MGKRVLLADDDQLLASLLNFRLKKAGMRFIIPSMEKR